MQTFTLRNVLSVSKCPSVCCVFQREIDSIVLSQNKADFRLVIMIPREIVQWNAFNCDYRVFPKWGRTFSELSIFRESDKSLKNELGSV